MRAPCAVLLASVAAVVSTGARADDATESPAMAIAVVKASTECLSTIVRATGTLVPRATAMVALHAPGLRITDVSVKEGDRIRAGDTMAVASGPSPSPSAAAQGQDGKGETSTRISIASLAIKSPVSGLVLSRNAEIGFPLSTTNGPLFTLAVDGEMEALVDVPGLHVLEIGSGQSAHIALDDGREFSGHVRLAPAEIKATQFGEARITIDSEQNLQRGRLVRIAIDARRSCGIAVPLGALMHESNGIKLQVVRNQTIETRSVGLGIVGDTDAQVTDGVAEGDLVVLDAGGSLHDGDKVSPIVADAQDLR